MAILLPTIEGTASKAKKIRQNYWPEHFQVLIPLKVYIEEPIKVNNQSLSRRTFSPTLIIFADPPANSPHVRPAGSTGRYKFRTKLLLTIYWLRV